MDTDLGRMSREQLIDEVKKLRNGIRAHRDATLHELCWHHPQLWGLLPDDTDPLPEVPDWPQFLEGCLHYRRSLDEQAPDAPRSHEAYDERIFARPR
jgi:hypothetical protein